MTDAAGTTSYVRDSEGNLISRRADGRSHYYLLDGLGSVVGLLDETGVKVNSYRYDPYGMALAAVEAVPNPWRYAGLADPTGLVKFGERCYDPALGRFTQPDPSGQDLPYGYAGCNPVNRTDPSGLLTACDLVGAVVGGLISLVPSGRVLGFVVGTPAGVGITETCALASSSPGYHPSDSY
jgi:RHS repeat-associated protein